MAELIKNRHQARKVRFVTWGVALMGAGFIAWAAHMSQSYGLSPGDGGVLRPPAERWGAAAILALCGLVPLIGIAYYARLYVIRLVREGLELRVTVIGLLTSFTRTYAVTDVGRTSHHAGENYENRAVSTPWTVLRIAGRPYIIDRQAEWIDGAAISRLTKDAERARKPASRSPKGS